jgi:hypothetical protein
LTFPSTRISCPGGIQVVCLSKIPQTAVLPVAKLRLQVFPPIFKLILLNDISTLCLGHEILVEGKVKKLNRGISVAGTYIFEPKKRFSNSDKVCAARVLRLQVFPPIFKLILLNDISTLYLFIKSVPNRQLCAKSFAINIL